MDGFIKKHSYWALTVGVLLVAVAAIGAYVWHFWGHSPPDDPGRWADFATYISGTVGVAAVVATLIAFVITLRQQQKLINSQEEMLKEQKNQIKLVEIQNSAYENSHRVNLAYSRAKEMSPSLIRYFEKWPSAKIYPYLSREPSLYQNFSEFFASSDQRIEKFINYPDLLLVVLQNCPLNEVSSFSERFFRPIEVVYKFVVEQVEIVPELDVYFESEFLMEEKSGVPNKFYFHCYQAFLIGKGDRTYKKGVGFFDLESDYSQVDSQVLKEWQRIGELAKL